MANKKQKYYYYVLVFTNDGPVYVTGIENATKWAHFDKSEKPMEFSSSYAEDLAFGLTVNGNSAVSVKSRYEINHQPYNYDDYECKWTEKENKEDK